MLLAPRRAQCAMTDTVSVIVAVFNAAPYLDACLGSVLAQTHRPLQLSVYDDGSNDESPAIISRWVPVLKAKGISVVAGYNTTQTVKAVTKFNPGRAFIIHLMNSFVIARTLFPGHGPGVARNRAIAASSGQYLCILDADDVMDARRVEV